MTNDRPQLGPDEWSAWLLEHRHGRDPVVEKALRTEVAGYVDRILDAAQLEPAMTLADVGTRDGVVAFRAIERVGPSLRVLMADISAPLLRHTESLAAQRNVRAQCTFFQAPADDLAPIADACVDVVTTRAALAYVADKRAALREFHRILRPGGRVCVAEPILQDDAIETIGLKRVADANRETEQHEVLSLLHRWKAAQFPDTTERLAASPIANFSERDLLGYFQECDFSDIHLELHIDVRPGCPGIRSYAAHPIRGRQPTASSSNNDSLMTSAKSSNKRFAQPSRLVLQR